MVPQHARRSSPSCSPRGCTTAPRILDAGCGPGGNGAWLATHGDVVGVDLSADALAFVRARRPTTRPVRASVEALPFADGAFDVVVGLTILYTVPDDARAVAELARVLRPGGARAARRARVRRPRPGPRRHRARPAPLPSAPGSSALAVAAGLTVAPRHLRVLVPRAARRRARRRSTGCATGATPRRAPTSTSARSTACSRRWPTASAAGWPRTTCRSGLAGPARYPLTGRPERGPGGARPAAPRARRGPTACGGWRRAGRTPTCRSTRR